MISALFTAVVAAVAVTAQGTTNGILVTTPSTPVFCQPTLLSWSGGTAPYFVNINVGGSISQVLETILTSSTATSYTWIADIAPGTSITLAVKDSTGAANYAAQVTVSPNPSGVTTCAGASSNVNSASVVNTVSATATVTESTVSRSSGAAASSAAGSSSSAAGSASSAAGAVGAVSSKAAGASSSVAAAVSSVTGRPSAAVSGVVASASSAVAAATSRLPGGASAVYGASAVTVGLIAVGSVALFL